MRLSVGPYNEAMTCLKVWAGAAAGALGVLLCGCNRPAAESGRPDFFPLHSEDTWVYEVARPLRNLRSRMTVRVRDERYIRALGRRCRLVDESYESEETPFDTPDTEASARPEIYPVAYCHKDGFLHRTLSLEYQGDEVHEVGLGSNEERFLPDGLGGDLAWDSLTTAYDLGGGNGYGVRQSHHTVIEPTAVDVPAGRFTGCVRVDTVALQAGRRDGRDDGEALVLYYSDWYAPNVGLVRTRQSNRPDGGPAVAQIELLAYDVEGAKR